MKNNEIKDLCMAILMADSKDEIVEILKKADLWDNPDHWRYYGDKKNNAGQIGGQARTSDAALAEKIVNSIDAVLLNKCLEEGINPQDNKEAPHSIREAVARYFDKLRNPNGITAGNIGEWSFQERTEVAKNIAVVATGYAAGDGNPCYTIVDKGEGQSPNDLPKTILSLSEENKVGIPFVQGRFNMGGGAALRFCGEGVLQLVISRRNPNIFNGNDPSGKMWGFTVVREEKPTDKILVPRYTYLAPINSANKSRYGDILRFIADELPLFPNNNIPYKINTKWGTLIKLYEYEITGYSKSDVLRPDGLLGRIDLRLPGIPMPIRLHECRPKYKGSGGNVTTVSGLNVRLAGSAKTKLEDEPLPLQLRVDGEEYIGKIYVFQKNQAKSYRKNEGVLFTVNGQTHGQISTDFFRRKSMKLSILRKDLLVEIDCTNVSNETRYKIFMTSRDRLSESDKIERIKSILEYELEKHPRLRELKEKRLEEDRESRLKDENAMEEVLANVIKHSPSLSSLFLPGTRLSTPFRSKTVQPDSVDFKGQRSPSFFKFKDHDYGFILEKNCHVNNRCRITFETDATNDYFNRNSYPGTFNLFILSKNIKFEVQSFTRNLWNGIATLNITLPSNYQPLDVIEFRSVVSDKTRAEPFVNDFVINVLEPSNAGGKKGSRRKPPGDDKGKGRESAVGIELPKPIRIYEDKWDDHDFDRNSAMKIVHIDTISNSNDNLANRDIYQYYINMDNIYLKTYIKSELSKGRDERFAQTRYEIALVLITLAVLHDYQPNKQKNNQDEEGEHVEDLVYNTTKALAPFILPMIDALGSPDLDSADDNDKAELVGV